MDPSRQALQILNLDALSELRLLQEPGAPDVIQVLAAAFVSDSSLRIARARRELDAGLLQALARTAQQIADGALTMGAEVMESVAGGLVLAAAAGDRAGAFTRLAELAEVGEATRGALDDCLGATESTGDRASGTATGG